MKYTTIIITLALAGCATPRADTARKGELTNIVKVAAAECSKLGLPRQSPEEELCVRQRAQAIYRDMHPASSASSRTINCTPTPGTRGSVTCNEY